MATTTINFSEEGSYYYSDPITAVGDSMAVQVKMAIPGGIAVQRSITGKDWTRVDSVAPYYSEADVVEFNVGGMVPGQQIRLKFGKGVPETITVLQ